MNIYLSIWQCSYRAHQCARPKCCKIATTLTRKADFRVRVVAYVVGQRINLPLFLQQLLDVLHVVEGAVEVEGDLRHDAELLAYLGAELAAQRLRVLSEYVHHGLSLV